MSEAKDSPLGDIPKPPIPVPSLEPDKFEAWLREYVPVFKGFEDAKDPKSGQPIPLDEQKRRSELLIRNEMVFQKNQGKADKQIAQSLISLIQAEESPFYTEIITDPKRLASITLKTLLEIPTVSLEKSEAITLKTPTSGNWRQIWRLLNRFRSVIPEFSDQTQMISYALDQVVAGKPVPLKGDDTFDFVAITGIKREEDIRRSLVDEGLVKPPANILISSETTDQDPTRILAQVIKDTIENTVRQRYSEVLGYAEIIQTRIPDFNPQRIPPLIAPISSNIEQANENLSKTKRALELESTGSSVPKNDRGWFDLDKISLPPPTLKRKQPF